MSKRIKTVLALTAFFIFPLLAVLFVGKLIFEQMEKINFDFDLNED
jgi:nitrate reductase NapE component